MDHEDLSALEAEEVGAGPHCLAALVHEGLGFEQSELSVSCNLCMEFLAPLLGWVEVVTK